MCGGAGTRLWPASVAERPKQFLSLAGGDESPFQHAVRRVTDLVNGRQPIVIGGLRHFNAICAQLATIRHEAAIILEPEPRDSAPAIGAAAAAIVEQDPEGVGMATVPVGKSSHRTEGA